MATNPDFITISENEIGCLRHFVKLPLCYQETQYTCGVACVQSLLASYGIIYQQDVLSEILKSKPIYGTDYQNILSFMQKLGFQALFNAEMDIRLLRSCIDDGITPILIIQAYKEDVIDYDFDWSNSHYVIACGYDEGRIIFMDPYTLGTYTYIPNDELLKRWHCPDAGGHHYYYSGLIIKNENLPMIYNPHIIKHQD
jgi:ABC-type bacteriocin/lantibiotic exporter with double-glycine peptidase domain